MEQRKEGRIEERIEERIEGRIEERIEEGIENRKIDKEASCGCTISRVSEEDIEIKGKDAHNGVRRNNMGGEVKEGFKCKPVIRDSQKPIMHYKTHIMVCTGGRCGETHAYGDIAEELRMLTKELGLNRGENRIKVTKSDCFGACRFKAVAVIYKNTEGEDGSIVNSCLWLRRTQKYDKSYWRSLFESLRDDINLRELLDESSFIPMQVY